MEGSEHAFRAIDSKRRLVQALRRSADAHDRAARLFDLDAGRAGQAARHRASAVDDRTMADDIEQRLTRLAEP
jgi:hypothetical protein